MSCLPKTSSETHSTTLNFNTGDLKVDWITDKLYWTIESPGTIGVFDLTNGHSKTLFTFGASIRVVDFIIDHTHR